MTPEQLARDGSEHGHQTAFFAAVALHHRWLHNLLFAIPNGGARGDDPRTRKIRGATLKAEGVKDSIPDIFCAVSRSSYHGLFIELKRPKSERGVKGTATPEQLICHTELRQQGFAVYVCVGYTEALSCLEWYLAL